MNRFSKILHCFAISLIISCLNASAKNTSNHLPPNEGMLARSNNLERIFESPVNVYLVLTSEYMGAPASAFGHIFILLSDDKRPSLDDLVIYFTADGADSEQGLFRTFKGLTGGFRGSYKVSPFFYFYHKYSKDEMRDLFVFDLKLSTKEVKRLKEFFFAHSSSAHDYYFLTDNCASKIGTMISYAKGREDSLNGSLFVSPGDVVDEFKSGPPQALPSYHRLYKKNDFYMKMLALENEETSKESFFKDIKRTSLSPSLDTVDIDYSVLKPSLLSFKYFFESDDHKPFVSLGFSPALLRLEEPQYDRLGEAELELLSGSIQFRHDKLKLEKFKLLSVKKIESILGHNTPLSWEFESLLTRKLVNQEDKIGWKTGFFIGGAVGKEVGVALLTGGESFYRAGSLFHYFGVKSILWGYLTEDLKISLTYSLPVGGSDLFSKSAGHMSLYWKHSEKVNWSFDIVREDDSQSLALNSIYRF